MVLTGFIKLRDYSLARQPRHSFAPVSSGACLGTQTLCHLQSEIYGAVCCSAYFDVFLKGVRSPSSRMTDLGLLPMRGVRYKHPASYTNPNKGNSNLKTLKYSRSSFDRRLNNIMANANLCTNLGFHRHEWNHFSSRSLVVDGASRINE